MGNTSSFSSENQPKRAVHFYCPFQSGSLMANLCDGDKCACWISVKSNGDGRKLISGCALKLGNLALVKLVDFLEVNGRLSSEQ